MQNQKANTLKRTSALFITAPRLAGGAPWASDILLGSLPLAVLGFIWGYQTPLRERTHRWGTALDQKLLG